MIQRTFTSLLLLATVCFAQTTGSKSTIHGGVPTGNGGRPCLLDVDRDVVPDCIREASNGKLIIAPQYVKDLHFDYSGLARVWSGVPPKVGMYCNKKGAFLIRGAQGVKNEADFFWGGLVRTVVANKSVF